MCLLSVSFISLVFIMKTRINEIKIDVDSLNLRQYEITFQFPVIVLCPIEICGCSKPDKNEKYPLVFYYLLFYFVVHRLFLCLFKPCLIIAITEKKMDDG